MTHVRQLREQIHACEDELRQATQTLASRLLPLLDVPSLDCCRRFTGLDFLSSQLLEHVQREQAELQEQQRRLEQDPQFDACPKLHAELHQEEQERISRHRAALLPLLQACHGHPRFQQLVRSGFGTPRYTTPFWRLSFYADRSAAAELCQRTGKKSWTDLLHDYQAAAESYDVLSERLQDLGTTRPRTPREQWELLDRRLQALHALHLQTARSRLQLALLKGGGIWACLERAEIEPELQAAVQQTALLHDKLQELRRQRTLGAQLDQCS